jgi:uncharacterized membrane protein YebE (DUF533 family)
MGLFDFTAKQPAPEQAPVFVNACAAFVAVMCCAVSADGYIDDLETDAMAKSLLLKRSFQGCDVFDYYNTALSLINEYGVGHVIKPAAGMLNDEEKRAALVITVDLLFANGIVNEKEQHFVDDLATALNLDRAWARSAIEIITLKYN